MRKSFLSLAITGAMLAAACGGDDTTGGDGGGIADASTHADAAVDAGSTGNNDAAAADAGADLKLQGGNYNASKVTAVSDGCMLELEKSSGTPATPNFPGTTLVNTQTELDLGTLYTPMSTPAWTPMGYALGKGSYTTHTTATLSTMAAVDTKDGCTYNVTRTSVITVTADNTIDVDFTDAETNHAGCAPITADCTSHYTFTLTKASP